MTAMNEARRALRVAGFPAEDIDRFAAALVAVATAVRDDIVSQIAQTTVARPGDTLILRVSDGVPTEHAEHLGQIFTERFPEIEVFVLSGAVDEMTIRRPEAAE